MLVRFLLGECRNDVVLISLFFKWLKLMGNQKTLIVLNVLAFYLATLKLYLCIHKGHVFKFPPNFGMINK